MIDLTAFQQHVLLDIGIREAHTGESPHGLAIKEDLQEMYGHDVNHGRLYPNLDDLVDAGLVEKGQRDRRTNEYSLSDAGEEMIAEYRDLIDLALGGDLANPYADASSAVSGPAGNPADAD